MGAPLPFLTTVPPASLAGAYTVADPGSSDALLGVLVIATDVPQWVTLGFGATGGSQGSLAETAGPIAVALYVGPGGLAIDWHNLALSALGAAGRQVTVTTSVPSGLGVILTLCPVTG